MYLKIFSNINDGGLYEKNINFSFDGIDIWDYISSDGQKNPKC
jgi:hypothetical protein